MSIQPAPPQNDRTVLYIVLGVFGGFLLVCMAPAILIVVCLAAIQVLGKNASTTFQTVGMSISNTGGPGGMNTLTAQQEAKASADEFVALLLGAQYNLAYSRTTPDYQKKASAKSLRELWDGDPVLRRRDDLNYRLEAMGGGTANQHTFSVVWTDGADRAALMTVQVVRSADGEWQIHRCTVP